MKFDFGNMGIIYLLTAGVFFIMDLLWLGVIAKELYARHIGDLLREQVNWIAAVAFYAIYIGGIQVFVLMPAFQNGSGVLQTAFMGALLGIFAYSTFDLTCLALIRNWSVKIVIIDIIWGAVLTGSTSASVVWLSRFILRLY